MSATILAEISRLPQLTSSLRTTAQRLAYYADGTGTVQKAYSYLAKDLHVSVRTVIRHIAKLEAMAVITKRVRRVGVHRCAVNVYTFLTGLPRRAGDKVARDQAQRENSSRAREETTSPSGLAWLRTVGLQPAGDFLRWCASVSG